MIERNAYAKINLGLEVIGRRDDGYHDIVSVLQLIDLHDTLTFTPAPELQVSCDDTMLAAEGESNLVWRAARLLQAETGTKAGAHIALRKRIPVSAGLGGGSSDAVATLRGLAELWGLTVAKSYLRELASALGADVAFFLDGPTALVEGRGERVTRLPPPPPYWVVLVCQQYDVPNKTKRLYESLSRKDMSDGNVIHHIISVILNGDFPPGSLLSNTFERAAYNIFDDLHKVRQKIAQAGGRAVHLSGSGPTLYTLFPQAEAARARALHETLQAENLPSYLARTLVSSSD